MAFAPSASWNSRSITHLANYPSPSLPMIFSDESHLLARFLNWCSAASTGRAALQRRVRCGPSLIVWCDLGRQPEGWLYPVYANSETGLAVAWVVPAFRDCVATNSPVHVDWGG